MSKALSLGLTGIKGFLVFPSGFNDITLSCILGLFPEHGGSSRACSDFLLEEGAFPLVFLTKGLSVN